MKPFFTEADCDRGTTVVGSNGQLVSSRSLSLDHANRLLSERGDIVYQREFGNWAGSWCLNNKGLNEKAPTHQAILINIEEIEPDSAEQILRDISDDIFSADHPIRKRIKALLTKEKK